MIQATDGNLYGVASFGGLSYGVLYRMSTAGTGFTALYTFHSTDGRRPLGPLVQGPDGRFYGTTYQGGAFDLGTAFQLDVSTSPATLNSLYNFAGADGAYPTGALLAADATHFYGTTSGGGAAGDGTIFALDITSLNPFGPGGALTTLYGFHYSDGAQPLAGLTLAPDGQFYGTTDQGGEFGLGTVFAITPGGALTTAHSFSAAYSDGATPVGGLLLGTDGRLYGGTYAGGSSGEGMIYALQPGALVTLHGFAGADGSAPLGGLIQATDGNLYGTTSGGGAGGFGQVFSLGLDSGLLAPLHAFTSSDGSYPQSTLMQGLDGTLYGVSQYGSADDGTVFHLSLSGAGFASLYAFSGSDGAFPNGPLAQGPDGSLYGTTGSGGANGGGTLFGIPQGGQFTSLQDFDYYPDGGEPAAGLTAGLDGNFYGTTQYGGLYGYGTVFSVSPLGTETVLYNFGISDGAYPAAGLTLGNDGSFYGSTASGGAANAGTLFRLFPSGTLATLYSFSAPNYQGFNSDGAYANTLAQGPDGLLYGTASAGGPAGLGTIFSVSPGGTFTTRYGFSGPDGATPTAGLALGADGNFYGTTSAGGPGGSGTAFEFCPNPAGNPAPGLDVLSPPAAPSGSGALTLIIAGVSFAPGATLAWNGAPLATTFVGGSELTATVPSGLLASVGVNAVTVVNPDNQVSTALPFTVFQAPAPVILGLKPGSALAGSPAFSLTVDGSGFLPGASVTWNGSALVTTSVSASELTAAVPASDIAAVGSSTVQVVNPGGGTSAGRTFSTYLPPVLFALNPAGAVVGTPGLTLAVAGANFTSGATVTWNGAALTTTFNSSGSLSASVPAGDLTAAGKALVAVVNPDGHATAALSFPIRLPTSPLLSGLSPNAAVVGGASLTLTLSGTSFRAGAKAKWNGGPLATTFVSATQLTATIPAAYLSAVATFKVIVTNPAPGGATTAALLFTVLSATGNPAPTATSLTPSSGTAGGSSFTLSVTGTGFASGATAYWNGTRLPTTFVSATALTVSVPSTDLAAVSLATVSVVNPDHQATGGLTFRVNAPSPPTLTALLPASLTAGAPDTHVTVNGSGFIPGAVVNWNGTALVTTFVSTTQLTALAPARYLAFPGSASVTVTTPGGTSSPVALTITYTRVRILVGTMTRNAGTGVITVPVTVQNYGYHPATGLQVTLAKLGAASTSTALPMALPDLAAGTTTPITLPFPGSAGASGTTATLEVAGSYVNGTFDNSVTLTLP